MGGRDPRDGSTRVLEVARAGIWSADKAKEIPSPYLERYMLKGRRSQEDKMKGICLPLTLG